jgi:hypothetical protein
MTRLHFPTSARPKGAAKHIARVLNIKLSRAQDAVASICGYQDWFDLSQNIAAGPPCPLDGEITVHASVTRSATLALALAEKLGIPDGDAQYALTTARLTGDGAVTSPDHVAIRWECWRQTVLPPVAARQPGAVGRLKIGGRNGEVVILRRYGRSTEVITHGYILTAADFEFVSPRSALPPFLPMRLHMPYGYWTEKDGARVIFSRDYHPLWRVRGDTYVERLEPWLWIEHVGETHLWEEGREPWNIPELAQSLYSVLSQWNVRGLPILADALPLLIRDPSEGRLRIADAAKLLREHREPSAPMKAA